MARMGSRASSHHDRTRRLFGVLVVSLFVSTSACASWDPTTDGLRRAPSDEVESARAFVEAYFEERIDDLPLVLIGTRDAIVRYVASQTTGTPWPKTPHLLRLPRSRAALGLASEGWAMPLVDAAGYYDSIRNIIVLRTDDAGTANESMTAMLVHELTHALFARSTPTTDSVPSYDAGIASWMMSEGRADAAAWAWWRTQPIPDTPVPAPTPDDPAEKSATRTSLPQIDLGSLGYTLVRLRVEHELSTSDATRDFVRSGEWPESSAPFFHLALPLTSRPEPVTTAPVPVDAHISVDDRLGMYGWAEVLGRDPDVDLAAILGWRGDRSVSYSTDGGSTLCVAARIATADPAAAAAADLATALRQVLPTAAWVRRDARFIELNSCEGTALVSDGPANYGVFASIMDTALTLQETEVDDQRGVLPSWIAMCASFEVHEQLGWGPIYNSDVGELDQLMDEAVADCR